MTIKLGHKQLLMITYFLTDNRWTPQKELKEFFKNKMSDKTIITTLKLNKLQKEAPFFLFNITLDQRGKVYQLKTELNTFLLLAENFLKSPHSLVFFGSKYTQLFLKNNKEKILKKIIENLQLDVDEESSEKIWDVMIKSHSSLRYGLFGEKPKNQMDFFEKLILSMLTDLKNDEFYFQIEFANEDNLLQLVTIKIEIDEHIGYNGKVKKNKFFFSYYP